MIKYALACDGAHEFEGWFGSSVAYDEQSAMGLLTCPVCGSGGVRKQIMAPAVAGTRKQNLPPANPAGREAAMEALSTVRRYVEDTFDYVGDAFAREARAIHEGRSEARNIYGEASVSEAQALVEDGVPVALLPPAKPAKDELN